MARCVNCGQRAAEPVWAVHADPAFKHKPQSPFALHSECFENSKTITASEWRPAQDDSSRLELVETKDSPRYRQVDPPEEA